MLSYKDGVLHVEQRPLSNLVEETGTPFFLFSEAQLRANFAALNRGLSWHEGPAIIRYCSKTNNEAGVLKIIAACESEVMASHPAEVRLAVQCGFAPEHIWGGLWTHGPAKAGPHLRLRRASNPDL